MREIAEGITIKRDRLLASLTLTAGVGLIVALPFALRAGAEFFLPVTAALVIAIALVPLLEWFERRGVPSRLAAGLCVIIFLAIADVRRRLDRLPGDRLGGAGPRADRPQVKPTLEPVLDLYKALDRFIDKILSPGRRSRRRPRADGAGSRRPTRCSGLIATSAPHAADPDVLRAAGDLLLPRRLDARCASSTIVSRGSFEGALTTARVIQQVVDATSTYLGTITVINVTLGALTALILWRLGMDSPLMWGGIVAVLNYIPYLGPIASALLLFVGGLMTFPDAWSALLPPAIFIGLHLVEANVVTPMIVGKRLTISPLVILISLSFWAWVWGTTGALLAVPLLIIMKTDLLAPPARPTSPASCSRTAP